MSEHPTRTVDLRVAPFRARYLELTWSWSHDPEIQWLTQQQPFTREAQREWFRSLPGRTDYLIWGVEKGGVPIGVFGIKGIEDAAGEYWGYIGDKALWHQGIGRWMVGQALERARTHGLARLRLKVLKDHVRAIRLYESMGFEHTGTHDRLLLMERPL